MASNNLNKNVKTEVSDGHVKGEALTTCATINTLNDDCLLHIFSFLHNPRDLVSVERVCKRWCEIMSSPQAWRKVIFEGLDGERYLWNVLRKYGHKVVNLKINAINHSEYLEECQMGFLKQVCPNLQHLYIDFKGFVDIRCLNVQANPYIKNLKSLTLCELEEIEDEDEYLEDVLQLLIEAKNLEHLSLCHRNCQKISIQHKGRKVKIRNFDTSNETLVKILDRFQELTYLKVGFMNYSCEDEIHCPDYEIDFPLYESLAYFSKKITSLSLTDIENEWFKGDELEALKFSTLKKLSISKCPKLRDDCILTLTRNCPVVEEFILDTCPKISDIVILTIAQNCLLLKNIHLTDNKNVTNVGYRHLADAKNLIYLAARKPKINGATVTFLAENCKKLQEIYCLKSWKLLYKNK